jgi:cyclophilin family peptidyl-prolyl cis-trans isomerase
VGNGSVVQKQFGQGSSMFRNFRYIALVTICLASTNASALAEEKKPPAPAISAAQAKATFDSKFDDWKAAIRNIEKLQSDFQTADDANREKLNAELAAHVAHAQSLVNSMVEAAEAAYRVAPNTDPKVTDFLGAVARHYTIGKQIGPPFPSHRKPDDIYYPIDGGDQYERAMPIIKVLIDGHASDKELFVWGFICAYMTNDYDLARTYLEKVKQTRALNDLSLRAQRGDRADPQAGLMKTVMRTVETCITNLDEYQELWKKESAIRQAEKKADNLPRVKLTTTKGEITLELFENEAPQTVANFLTLVKQGFYNGSPFHRVLPEFMAQGGSKDDKGVGGPGYNIRDEFERPDFRRHFRGSLSLANTGQPETGDSQFFLTFVATPHLNGRHTVFGRVIDGLEVLGDLQRRSPDHDPNPPKADSILKAEVVRDRGHEYKFERLPAH